MGLQPPFGTDVGDGGLVARAGGAAAFEARLDEIFDRDIAWESRAQVMGNALNKGVLTASRTVRVQ